MTYGSVAQANIETTIWSWGRVVGLQWNKADQDLKPNVQTTFCEQWLAKLDLAAAL